MLPILLPNKKELLEQSNSSSNLSKRLKYPEWTGSLCYVDSDLIMERKQDDILDLLVKCLEAWLTWLEEDNKNLAAEMEEKQWRTENEAYSLNEYTYNWEFTEKWE